MPFFFQMESLLVVVGRIGDLALIQNSVDIIFCEDAIESFTDVVFK